MRHPLKRQMAVLVCGIGLLAWQHTIRAQQPKQSLHRGASPVKDTASRIWRSETTGKEYRVKVDEERFYAEWVNIPPDQAKHGAQIRSEGFRSGSKWIGVSRSLLPLVCAAGEKSSSKEKVIHWCRLTTRIEIDSVTADKITGHGDTLKNFNCQTCQILETGWKDFEWVPKR